MGANVSALRPARDLLHQLPLLPTRPDFSVDYEAADAALLLAVAENGETVMDAFQLGLSALGVILAHASPEVGSEIGSDTIEALGWFMAETADIAAVLLALTRACRHYTADYAPAKVDQRTDFRADFAGKHHG